MVVSGVLTYAFQILAARRLGAEAFGQIAALWGGVFLLAIVLFRPLEQTLSRSIANRLAQGQEIRSVLRSIGLVSAGAAVAIAIAAVFGWSSVTRGLFHGDGFMTAMLVVGVVGYGASYLVRGLSSAVSAGSPATPSSSLRTRSAGSPLRRRSSSSPRPTLLLPRSRPPVRRARLPRSSGPAGGCRTSVRADRATPFDARGAVRFAGPAGVVAAVDQLLINGAPLLVILLGTGGTKEAGVVFAATMLVRAPVYVFTGVAASLLPNFTLLGNAGRAGARSMSSRRTVIILAGRVS